MYVDGEVKEKKTGYNILFFIDEFVSHKFCAAPNHD